MNIVQVNGKFGVFSFAEGFKSKSEPTLLEWARVDFDACMAYLFRRGLHEEAEEIFDRLICGRQ